MCQPLRLILISWYIKFIASILLINHMIIQKCYIRDSEIQDKNTKDC